MLQFCFEKIYLFLYKGLYYSTLLLTRLAQGLKALNWLKYFMDNYYNVLCSNSYKFLKYVQIFVIIFDVNEVSCFIVKLIASHFCFCCCQFIMHNLIVQCKRRQIIFFSIKTGCTVRKFLALYFLYVINAINLFLLTEYFVMWFSFLFHIFVFCYC